MTTTTTRITALALAGVLLVAGCSSDTGQDTTPTAETTAPTLEATAPATEPAVDETPEVEVPTEIGATVPADQVDAARDAGAAVYVSPNGAGEGVVIDPTVTPGPLVEDTAPIDAAAPSTLDDFDEVLGQLSEVDRAAEAAQTGVFVLMAAPDYGPDGSLISSQYSIGMVGYVAGHTPGGNNIRPTKEAAIAAVQHLIDQNPGYEIIDLTD